MEHRLKISILNLQLPLIYYGCQYILMQLKTDESAPVNVILNNMSVSENDILNRTNFITMLFIIIEKYTVISLCKIKKE